MTGKILREDIVGHSIDEKLKSRVRREFQAHALNSDGILRAHEMRVVFTTALDDIERLTAGGTDRSEVDQLVAMVRSRLQEASMLAVRAVACISEHQVDATAQVPAPAHSAARGNVVQLAIELVEHDVATNGADNAEQRAQLGGAVTELLSLRRGGKAPVEYSELPCRACKQHHPLGEYAIGVCVRVVEGHPLGGLVGRVLSWSQYGGPIYYRVQFDKGALLALDPAAPSDRANLDPCALVARAEDEGP